MSYCVNCGVELSEGETVCPLCETPVVHPGRKEGPYKAPYPPYRSVVEQPVRKSGIAAIVGLVLLLPAVLTLISDLSINRRVSWSIYCLGACALLALFAIPPILSKKGRPLWFLFVDSVGIAAYLWLIEFATGGDWFLTLGLPLTAGAFLPVWALSFARRRLGTSRLKILGGAILAIGLFLTLTEILVRVTTHKPFDLVWSPYPAATMLLFGVIVFLIDANAPLKARLARKLFL